MAPSFAAAGEIFNPAIHRRNEIRADRSLHGDVPIYWLAWGVRSGANGALRRTADNAGTATNGSCPRLSGLFF
jgi:hypothetical protein